VLLAAGAKGKRYSLPNSRIMIHQGSGGFRGNTPDVFIQVKELELLNERLHEILAEHTSQPVDKIRKDTDRDYFMSPEQARDYGIIDAVYSNAGDPLTSLGRPGGGSSSEKGRSDDPGDSPAAAKG
jgi:ATP-dependent Clp protease protease subunit